MKAPRPALVVVLAGISAALHVGKLPPALPVLQQELGVTLLQAGFLLSLVQLAGVALGLAMGAAADALGPRRTMVLGLVLLSVAGFLGGLATTPAVLLALRGCEGAGFLLATLPAPALIRQLVEPARLGAMLGVWGAYMPLGTAAALLLGPVAIVATGWPGWWWLIATLSLLMAGWLWLAVPAACDERLAAAAAVGRGRIARTVRAGAPWLIGLGFAAYSAQWLAVVGFLPTIYAQSGLPAVYVAPATALVAAVNMVGNIAAGRLLQRGVVPPALLQAGYLAMALGAILAFAPWSASASMEVVAARYAGVLLFSMVGGLVPATMFWLAVRLAPDEGTVSTTVGWVQQWSSLGQFVGPPLAALLAARSGDWSRTWWLTGGLAAGGLLVATLIGRRLRGRNGAPPGAPPS
ncbi:MAG: transporter-like protein [Ramlibacter sp.]|jgi:CP family cyanate transporter-like MFS transporter|uniref:MFS transporter n=1 Tax=Ramlibacter sp. TaxID=1917967 RepID=UPI002625AC07|nr:MFS transporter [Ramlibacter sp.]MDB5750199.1 transporter-like protein [Ramlibacter sp.]